MSSSCVFGGAFSLSKDRGHETSSSSLSIFAKSVKRRQNSACRLIKVLLYLSMRDCVIGVLTPVSVGKWEKSRLDICLENSTSLALNAFTLLYSSCTKTSFPWSLKLRSFRCLSVSTPNARSASHSVSCNSGKSSILPIILRNVAISPFSSQTRWNTLPRLSQRTFEWYKRSSCSASVSLSSWMNCRWFSALARIKLTSLTTTLTTFSSFNTLLLVYDAVKKYKFFWARGFGFYFVL